MRITRIGLMASLVGLAVAALFGGARSAAQTRTPVPRPAARTSEATDGSIAPDGYAPIPAWLGQTRASHPAQRETFELQTVASGIDGGFGFQFLPDGRILVSERAGRLRVVGRDGTVSGPVAGLPTIYARGPQGLFDVLPDREFARNRTLYVSYTALPDGSDPAALPRLAGILMVARARLSEDATRLENVAVILSAEGIGGRLLQATDGSLFVTSSIPAGVGIDSTAWPQPQQLDSLMGKILRVTTDGTAHRDNPFAGRAGARPEIYAFGIRDDQGVALHLQTGALWVSEHGPRGGDEINLIEKGKNYGFPTIGYGHEYSGKSINGDRTSAPGLEQPVYFWTPDIAPAGIAFYTGRLFPAWRGNLFVAALAGKHLARLVLDGRRVVAEERLLVDLDTRIRDVRDGPDGALYVLTDGPLGRIIKLVPKRRPDPR